MLSVLLVSSTGLAPGVLAISDDPPPGATRFADDPLAYQPALDAGPLGPGRQAYRERRNPERARESYTLFKRVVDQNPNDPVALWHLAMSCYYLGQRVVETKEERKRVFAEGHTLAENAVERDPTCAPCHMLAGVNQALWGQEMGIFRVLSGLPNVKRHLQLSTELDPTFAGASALRVRSQIARILPRWLGGGKDKARRYLSRAVQIAPNEPLNYQFLSKLLWKDFGDRKGALAVARRGLEVPEPGPEFVESVDAMRRLRVMVRKLEAAEQREKSERAPQSEGAAQS
jgi:tetratricopeptide (TPR) repeat protein